MWSYNTDSNYLWLCFQINTPIMRISWSTVDSKLALIILQFPPFDNHATIYTYRWENKHHNVKEGEHDQMINIQTYLNKNVDSKGELEGEEYNAIP